MLEDGKWTKITFSPHLGYLIMLLTREERRFGSINQ